MRRFYTSYGKSESLSRNSEKSISETASRKFVNKIQQTASAKFKLSWSHYLKLMRSEVQQKMYRDWIL